MEDNHKQVLSKLKSAGYKYVSNQDSYYNYECKKGHTIIKHYRYISEKGFCLECFKPGFNDVENKIKIVESYGYKKVSYEHGTFKFECKNGHVFSRTISSVSKNGFCRQCLNSKKQIGYNKKKK